MAGAAPLLDRAPDAPLFHTPRGPVTAAAFLRHAHAAAAALPPGRHLANLCRDRYAFAVAFAAGLIAGRTSLLNVDPASLPHLEAAYPGCTLITDSPAPDCGLPLSRVSERAPGAGQGAGQGANPQIPNNHPAAIVFTSGSTGAPTPHAKPWGALVARTRAAATQFSLSGGTIIGAVPPQHMYGFELTILLPLHAPIASWCGPAFFPGDVAAALLATPAPRILVTTPLQLRNLLHSGITLPPIAACISATAPLDPALAETAETAWSAPVLEIFGATECGSIASRRTTDGPDWTPYPGIDLRIDDAGTTVHAPFAPSVPLADVLEQRPAGFRLLGRRTDLVKLGGRRASLSGPRTSS